jgi:hypothetical protein
LIPLLISALALGSALLLYLKNPRRAILRILALLFLLLIATNSAFRFGFRKKAGPPVVLVDVSQSMARYLPEVNALTSDLRFAHQTAYVRDHRLIREPDESLGSYTDLTSALRAAAATKPSAIVLVSDGNHNYGPAPLEDIDDWNLPVYTVGCGPESLKDQAVSEVYFPAYVFRGDSTIIEAVIESRGFTRPETSRAVLESADKKIRLVRSFIPSDAPGKVKLVFPLVIRRTDTIGLRLAVSPQSGEFDYANNVHDFRLEVLPDKIKVLYYTDHLSFNTRFLVPILKTVSNFDLRAVARLSPDRWTEYSAATETRDLDDWRTFDVWILDDIDFRTLAGKDVTGFLNRKGGILVIGGIDNLTDAGRALLPIPIYSRAPTGLYPLQVMEPFSVLSPAGEYPPVSAVNRVIGANPKAVTICRSDKLPVIAYANYGSGAIFQINAFDVGAWQFSQSNTKNEGLLAALVPDIVRFLSTLGERNRLILKTKRPECEIGTPLNFTLQSFDRDLRPAGGGDFYLSTAAEKIPFFETRPYFYEAEFTPREKGDYELTAVGTLNGDSLKSRTLKIKVVGRMAETEKWLDRHLLQALAEKTGGRYVPLEKISGLDLPAGGYSRETRKLSPDHPAVYFIVFLLLAADWVLRRRRGNL